MTEKKMNVESFNLDHTKVVAPYIRLVGVYSGENGDKIYKYDKKNKTVSDDEIKEKLFDEYTNGLLKTLLPNNLTGPAWRKTIRIVLIITELRKNIVV